MIRVLIIGRDADDWVSRVAPRLPGAEVEGARLPAGGIRAFERSPADVVVLCGSVTAGRLAAVVKTLRAHSLGGVLPFIAVTDEPLDGVDVQLGDDAQDTLVDELFLAVGLQPHELKPAQQDTMPSTPKSVYSGVLSAADIEQKQREVRHETYFKVLGVSPHATNSEIAAAFTAQWRRFEAQPAVGELEEALAEVRDGLEDAYAVLGNDRLRAAYAEPRSRHES